MLVALPAYVFIKYFYLIITLVYNIYESNSGKNYTKQTLHIF